MSVKIRRSISFRLKPLPIFDELAVLELLDSMDVKPLHAKTIWRYLLRTPGASMETLVENARTLKIPNKIIASLQQDFVLLSSKVVEAHTSSDGSVTKLIVQLQDGLRVETVVIRHGATTARKQSESRTTLCISSQVGCKMGCTFCATGTMGEIGHLAMGEIVEQLIHARRYAEISNIVFMGMGEPLNNYKNVLPAARAMIDPARFQLSPNRVTISTVGVIPKMILLMKDLPQVLLALSLHAPTQKRREEIVPTAKAFKLDRLLEVSREYIRSTGRKLLIEYCLLKGVNDTEEVAHELGQLLQHDQVLINLIPYNPTDVGDKFQAPEKTRWKRFQDILVEEYGILTIVRKEMGQDIAGACGQLVVQKDKQKEQQKGKLVGDLEDTIESGSGLPSPQPSQALWPDISLAKDKRHQAKQKRKAVLRAEAAEARRLEARAALVRNGVAVALLVLVAILVQYVLRDGGWS